MPTSDDSPRRARFFDRFTEPISDRAKESIAGVEDRVRASVQGEIDAVSSSVKARAVQIRPSAVAFGAAALVALFGLALFVVAAVVGLDAVLELWLAALLVGIALVLAGAGLAAWGRSHLPPAAPLVPRVTRTEHPAQEQVHPWAD